MADEVMGMTGSFSVNTSSLDSAATRVQVVSQQIVTSLRNIKNETYKLGESSVTGRNSAWITSLGGATETLQKLDVQAKTTGTGMHTLGGRMMVVGQFADDMQYGLRAVVNQIPQLVGAFGGGLGLAGAIGIVAVGLNQLNLHWDTIVAKFGTGTSAVHTASEEMEQLGNKTKKTADEQERLNLLKQREETWNKLGKGKTPGEAQASSGTEQVLAETPGRLIQKGLSEIMRGRVGMTPEDEDKLKQARWIDDKIKASDTGRAAVDPLAMLFQYVHGTEAQQRKKIGERLDAEASDLAAKLIDEAVNGVGIVGENARKILAKEVERAPGAFPEGLGERLNSTTPQGRVEKLRRDAIAVDLETQFQMDAMDEAIGTPGDILRRRAISTDLEEQYQVDAVNEAIGTPAEIARNRQISLELEEQSQREAIEEDQKRLEAQKAAAIRMNNVAISLEERFQLEAEEQANGPARFGTKRAKEREQEWQQIEGSDERNNDLNWKLRGLLMRGAQASNTFGDADSYESSIKATSAEAQLKKLHDINETLKEIRKNTEGRAKLVERIMR